MLAKLFEALDNLCEYTKVTRAASCVVAGFGILFIVAKDCLISYLTLPDTDLDANSEIDWSTNIALIALVSFGGLSLTSHYAKNTKTLRGCQNIKVSVEKYTIFVSVAGMLFLNYKQCTADVLSKAPALCYLEPYDEEQNIASTVGFILLGCGGLSLGASFVACEKYQIRHLTVQSLVFLAWSGFNIYNTLQGKYTISGALLHNTTSVLLLTSFVNTLHKITNRYTEAPGVVLHKAWDSNSSLHHKHVAIPAS